MRRQAFILLYIVAFWFTNSRMHCCGGDVEDFQYNLYDMEVKHVEFGLDSFNTMQTSDPETASIKDTQSLGFEVLLIDSFVRRIQQVQLWSPVNTAYACSPDEPVDVLLYGIDSIQFFTVGAINGRYESGEDVSELFWVYQDFGKPFIEVKEWVNSLSNDYIDNLKPWYGPLLFGTDEHFLPGNELQFDMVITLDNGETIGSRTKKISVTQ